MSKTFRFSDFIPFAIGLTLSIALGTLLWRPFYFVFTFIGSAITFAVIYERRVRIPDLGRKIAILCIGIMFLVFFGIMQRENMQLEETVFYAAFFLGSGIFTRALIHFAIAKVGGPLIFGRGFCGWACWTAAIFEWLPIGENRKIPPQLTLFRIPMLLLSIALPLGLILTGYDYMAAHIDGDTGGLIQTEKTGQFLWFLAGNGLYFASGIPLAFAFRKKRAFCRMLCPVSLIMKVPAAVSLLKKKPTENKCIGCGKCNSICPMDVDVMGFIKQGLEVKSTECILCGQCGKACPVRAIG